ncbi:hypothetical protein [Methylobacterium nigriterrae]|uniref:hypothetical protein n=1 Tax=Methylobacterium nigriterrae TaxID=3127512 RepID=UPI0030132587
MERRTARAIAALGLLGASLAQAPAQDLTGEAAPLEREALAPSVFLFADTQVSHYHEFTAREPGILATRANPLDGRGARRPDELDACPLRRPGPERDGGGCRQDPPFGARGAVAA